MNVEGAGETPSSGNVHDITGRIAARRAAKGEALQQEEVSRHIASVRQQEIIADARREYENARTKALGVGELASLQLELRKALSINTFLFENEVPRHQDIEAQRNELLERHKQICGHEYESEPRTSTTRD